MARQLSDLMIDEVSLVYKGANQHAKVTIAKSADAGEQEDQVEIFDQDGNPLDVDALEHGDIVYSEDGQALQYDEDGEEDDESYVEDRELESVGKAWSDSDKGTGAWGAALGAPGGGISAGLKAKKGSGAKVGFKAGGRTIAEGMGGAALGAAPGLAMRKPGIARLGQVAGGTGGSAHGAASSLRNSRKQGLIQMGKSFSEDVRTELSKALTDADRDEVLAKAFNYVEYLEEVSKSAIETATEEREIRLTNEYLEIAKSYALPVSDEDLARVMKNCAESLSEEDCDVIAKCFTAASEAIYEEVGKSGGGANSNVLAEVEAYANSAVSKGFDSLDAMNAAFDANPDLYDQYLAGN